MLNNLNTPNKKVNVNKGMYPRVILLPKVNLGDCLHPLLQVCPSKTCSKRLFGEESST